MIYILWYMFSAGALILDCGHGLQYECLPNPANTAESSNSMHEAANRQLINISIK